MRVLDEAAVVGLVVVLCVVLQLTVAYLGKGGGQEVVFATHTPWVSGYFQAARDDVGDDWTALRGFLADYPAYIQRLPMLDNMIHVGQHPPGGVVFYWLQLRVLEGSPALTARLLRAGQALTVGDADALKLAGIQMEAYELAAVWSSYFALSLLCALTVAPVYALGRLMGGRAGAVAAVGLYITTPSMYLFSPHVDQLHLFLSASVCALWAYGLRHRSGWRCGLAGLGLGICLWVSLHFVALGAVCVLSALVWGWGCGTDVRTRVSVCFWPCLWLSGGLTLVVAAQYIGFSHNVFHVWWICLSKHETFYDHFPRTYWKWILVNILEFGLFLGVASVCLWVVSLARAIPRLLRRGRPSAGAAVSLAAALVLLLLNFSGKNLSEVARLWMFLMPVAAAAGGEALARRGRLDWWGWVWVAVATQFVQVVAFRLRSDVFSIY